MIDIENPARRELLGHAGALAALAALGAGGAALAGDHGKGHGHAHHGVGPYAALSAAAHFCHMKGHECGMHCVKTFTTGDTALAECMAQVVQMAPACKALSQLADFNSPHTLAMAETCAAICRDCETECRKHEQHAECKACADACLDLIAAIEQAGRNGAA